MNSDHGLTLIVLHYSQTLFRHLFREWYGKCIYVPPSINCWLLMLLQQEMTKARTGNKTNSTSEWRRNMATLRAATRWPRAPKLNFSFHFKRCGVFRDTACVCFNPCEDTPCCLHWFAERASGGRSLWPAGWSLWPGGWSLWPGGRPPTRRPSRTPPPDRRGGPRRTPAAAPSSSSPARAASSWAWAGGFWSTPTCERCSRRRGRSSGTTCCLCAWTDPRRSCGRRLAASRRCSSRRWRRWRGSTSKTRRLPLREIIQKNALYERHYHVNVCVALHVNGAWFVHDDELQST